jgi:hypothetical protein
MAPVINCRRQTGDFRIESGLCLSDGALGSFFGGKVNFQMADPSRAIGKPFGVSRKLSLQSEFISRRAPARVVRSGCKINCFKPQGAEQIN